jgi:hypothetical protein
VPYYLPLAFKQEFAAKYTPISQLSSMHYMIGADNDEGRKSARWFSKTQDSNFLKTVIGL